MFPMFFGNRLAGTRSLQARGSQHRSARHLLAFSGNRPWSILRLSLLWLSHQPPANHRYNQPTDLIGFIRIHIIILCNENVIHTWQSDVPFPEISYVIIRLDDPILQAPAQHTGGTPGGTSSIILADDSNDSGLAPFGPLSSTGARLTMGRFHVGI